MWVVCPFYTTHSFLTVTDTLSLGAGLSLSYLSEFSGPRQTACMHTFITVLSSMARSGLRWDPNAAAT